MNAVENRGVEPSQGDFITIVRAARRRLTKLWRIGGGSEGYNSARLFDLYEQPVSDLDTLETVLSRLQRRVDCAVVRGGVADPARTRSVRRTVLTTIPRLATGQRCWSGHGAMSLWTWTVPRCRPP